MSSDLPLYISNKTPKVVNPAKIVPSILKKSAPLRYSEQAERDKKQLLLQIPKDKKIKKQETDKRKHYRTKMCPYGRQCRKRFICTFAHTEQQLRKPFLHRKKPCILYQKGQCSLGSACRDYHGNMDIKKNYRYKEGLCPQFLQGHCIKGEICIFRHDNLALIQLEDEQPLLQLECELGDGCDKNLECTNKQQVLQRQPPQSMQLILQNKEVRINQKMSGAVKNGTIKEITQQKINPDLGFLEGGFSISFQ